MLSERLITVKDCVENANTVLDVGTDHGYVPICLIEEKKADKVIAADINEGPLKNAEKNVRLNGLTDKIELRLGGGLTPVKKGEADTVIIAGMGGIMISEIIKESFEKAKEVKSFILQPMNSQEDLRRYLILNGFKITEEKIAKENEKIYNILKVINKKEEPYEKEVYYYLGNPKYFDLKNDLTKLYVEKRRKQFKAIIDNLSSAKKDVKEEVEFYKKLLTDTEDFYA